MEILGHKFRVDEVAISSSFTRSFMVLSALRFPKIGDWRVFHDYLVHIVEFAIESSVTAFSLVFSGILDIHVSHHMLSNVIRYYQIQYLSMFANFPKNLLIKLFKMGCCFQ
jgi:hypothetical protein